jgi:hypothetical protein
LLVLIVLWMHSPDRQDSAAQQPSFNVSGFGSGSGFGSPFGTIEAFAGDTQVDSKSINYTETLSTTDGFLPTTPSNLRLYISAFSDLVAYQIEDAPDRMPTWDANQNVWRDLTRPDVGFRMYPIAQTASLPTKLKVRNAQTQLPTDIGAYIKNIKLIGPSSDDVGHTEASQTAVTLKSFTLVFYGVIETVDFAEGEGRKVLYRLTAENPNIVEIAIRRRDNRNVLLEVILGDASKAYQWVVDKYMLMSNRTPTMYTLVYDEGQRASPSRDPAIRFYIGKTKLEKRFTSDAPAPIRLGNSEIVINPEGGFDMKLIAFAHFKSPLEETAIETLGKYFEKQQSGIDVILTAQQQEFDAITVALFKKIDNASKTLEDVEGELQKCKDTASTLVPAVPVRHWQIDTNAIGVSKATAKLNDADIKQCSPLELINKIAVLVKAKAIAEGKLVDPTVAAAADAAKASKVPFAKVSAAPDATVTATTTKTTEGIKPPPASLSDPSASILKRIADIQGVEEPE